MSLIARVPSNVIILDFSKPGEEKLWKSKSLEYECWGERKDRETWYRPVTERQLSTTIIVSNLWKVFSLSKLLKVENWYCDVRTIGAARCHFLGKDTRIPTRFLSRGNSARWNRAIHCERGNTSWQTGATRCWSSKRSKATAIYHWKRWNRITIVSGIKIMRKQGEWSSAKKDRNDFQMLQKIERNILWFGECSLTVTMESAVFMNNCLWIQQISHLNKCSTYLQNWCLNKMRSMDWRQLVGENHSWKYTCHW